MDFTPQEHKMVEKLRKKQLQWPRGRWWLLIPGLLEIAGAFYVISSAISLASDDLMIKAIGCAVFCPIGFMMAFKGTHVVCSTIRDWNGNVHDTLLLKLIERSEEDQQKRSRD